MHYDNECHITFSGVLLFHLFLHKPQMKEITAVFIPFTHRKKAFTQKPYTTNSKQY